MAFGKETKLVIRRGPELTEAQLDAAFAVSETTPWYQALTQLIDEFRQEHVGLAPTWADSNNPLAMARELGSAQALTGLLIELERRRSKSAD